MEPKSRAIQGTQVRNPGNFFAYRIWNPGNFARGIWGPGFWNPEYSSRNPE